MRWRTILASLKSTDMRKRLFAVFFMIVIYRFLSHVPVPLAEPTELKRVIETLLTSTDFGGFLNILSGGALAQFSIVLVGLSPYITASITTQMLTKVIPKMEELHKDGESGRRKINQWTRLLTLPLAIVQSIAFIFILRQTILAGNTAVFNSTSPLEWVIAVTAMTAGAMLLMWLGELITEQGVGNGISLLIFAGIISQIPTTMGTIWSSLTQSGGEKINILGIVVPVDVTSFWIIVILALFSLAILYVLVKINEAQRVIHINYAKRVRGNTAYGGTTSILPVKLITAGVIPIIFAVAFLSLPAFVGQLLKATQNPNYTELANNLVKWFQAPQGGLTTLADGGWVYPAAYFVLVVLFTYFYTSIVFNSDEIAENLQKQGGFIAHIRPGQETAKYLNSVVNRLTLFGSIALGIISILPFITEYVAAQYGMNLAGLSIGGTSMLIVVSVALESLRQINSRALMVTYDEYK